MPQELISAEKALTELKKLELTTANYFIDSKGITPADFNELKKAVRVLTASNFDAFAGGIYPKLIAFNQLFSFNNKRKTSLGNFNSIQEKSFFLLKKFYPFIAKMINSPLLKKTGYSLQLGITADENTAFSFLLKNKSNELISVFNFNLLFNKYNEPVFIIGNMHGKNRVLAEKLKEKIGLFPLDFFIALSKTVFPEKQILALNPEFHHYKKKGINSLLVVQQLLKEGKSIDSASIEKEIKKRITATTGAHFSAFRGSSFNVPSKEQRKKNKKKPKYYKLK
ncbi:MAG: hypothetical protein JW703_00620 [Candidatus Diapherotrites archaeon]|nr:hypothetical protein [Candidatus Diapherotrites archaeon]